jgi:hypothetical protein
MSSRSRQASLSPFATTSLYPATGWLLGGGCAHGTASSGTDIYKVHPDSADKTYLTSSDIKWAPAWSFDGTNIIYTNGMNIWIMNADGSGANRSTRSGWRDCP